MVISEQDPTQLNLLFVFTKAGSPELKVSLGQNQFRSRCGGNDNLSMGSHRAKLIVCAYKGRQISELICYNLCQVLGQLDTAGVITEKGASVKEMPP